MHTTKAEEEERKSAGSETCLLVDRDLIAEKRSGHFNKTPGQGKKRKTRKPVDVACDEFSRC
jgi:hypothetical protein